MINLVFRWWQALSDFGLGGELTPTERKIRRLANQLQLYFVILLLSVDAIAVCLWLLNDILGMPEYYTVIYMASINSVLALVILNYFLIAKTDRVGLVIISLLGGAIFTIAMAMMLGRESGFHWFLVSFVPLAFFFFRVFPLWWIVGLQILWLISLLFLRWWFQHNEAFLPFPAYVTELIPIPITWSLVLSLSMCTYYLWEQNDMHEKQLLAEQDEVKRAHAALERKDRLIQVELDFAADIQHAILPETTQWRSLEFTSSYRPLGKVSGDYFDIVRFDRTVFVIMADVSGHGMPAALITMLAKRSFNLHAQPGASPAEVLSVVNRELAEQITTQDYLTAIVIRIDDDLHVTYSNGGHTRPLLLRADGSHEYIDTNGMLLGMIPEPEIAHEEKRLSLQSGDRIFLYTDGLNEQQNPDGEEYGYQRMQDILAMSDQSCTDLHDLILQSVDSHRGMQPMGDDLSFLTMRVV